MFTKGGQQENSKSDVSLSSDFHQTSSAAYLPCLLIVKSMLQKRDKLSKTYQNHLGLPLHFSNNHKLTNIAAINSSFTKLEVKIGRYHMPCMLTIWQQSEKRHVGTAFMKITQWGLLCYTMHHVSANSKFRTIKDTRKMQSYFPSPSLFIIMWKLL